ncbi:hypothetical protein ABE79_09125, partial [Proteus mirabilis]
GFIPENLDLSLLDRVIQITNEEAFDTARELMTKEGILAGISSGAAIAGSSKTRKRARICKQRNCGYFTFFR